MGPPLQSSVIDEVAIFNVALDESAVGDVSRGK